MMAVIDGVVVTGTPEEVSALIEERERATAQTVNVRLEGSSFNYDSVEFGRQVVRAIREMAERGKIFHTLV